MTEHQLQAKCFEWHWNEFPEERRMLHSNDNNSYNQIEGNKKKALGVVKGISDLEYITPGGVVWFIELKLPGEKQSPEQLDFMAKIAIRGHLYIIIYTFEQFKELIWKIIKNTGK